MENILSTHRTLDVFKEKNVVIVGCGQIGEGFNDILKANGVEHVFIISKTKNGENIFSSRKDLPLDIGEIDFIINTHKSPEIERTTKDIPHGFRGKMVFIQNGFDIKEKVENLGIKNSIFGLLNMSIKRQKDGTLKTTFAGTSPITGAGSEEFSALFNKHQQIFQQTNDFEQAKNLKGVMNSVSNSLCIAFNLPTKEAFDAFGIQNIQTLTKEIVDVVNHESDQKLDLDQVLAFISNIYKKFAHEFPSTHQDFFEFKDGSFILREKTLKHELDSMIGFVVKKAKKHDIAVPLTERIFNDIRVLERL